MKETGTLPHTQFQICSLIQLQIIDLYSKLQSEKDKLKNAVNKNGQEKQALKNLENKAETQKQEIKELKEKAKKLEKKLKKKDKKLQEKIVQINELKNGVKVEDSKNNEVCLSLINYLGRVQ